MATFDHVNLNRAADLLFAHKQRLESAALTTIHAFDAELSEIFVVCAEYDSQWRELIDQFHPIAKITSDIIRGIGFLPVFISGFTFGEFALFQKAEVPLPMEKLRTDRAWFLLLHEAGHTWAQLPITKPPKLDS